MSRARKSNRISTRISREVEGDLDDTDFLIWNNVLSEMVERLRKGVSMESNDYGGLENAIALVRLVLRIFHDSGKEDARPRSKALTSVRMPHSGA